MTPSLVEIRFSTASGVITDVLVCTGLDLERGQSGKPRLAYSHWLKVKGSTTDEMITVPQQRRFLQSLFSLLKGKSAGDLSNDHNQYRAGYIHRSFHASQPATPRLKRLNHALMMILPGVAS